MRLLIHTHIYYLDLWGELAACIDNFNGRKYDLWITTPIKDVAFQKNVLSRFPSAHYCVLPNQGYDIWPFFYVLNNVQPKDYDYVVKMHTKRNVSGWLNYLPFWPSRWRRELLSFCSSKSRLERVMHRFSQCPEIGMIGGDAVIVERADVDYERNEIRRTAEKVVQNLGYRNFTRRFVAGTMFIARMACFSPLRDVLRETDFQATKDDDNHVSGVAHVYERVLGYIVSATGFEISDVNGRFKRLEFTLGIRQYLLIRICKPLYRFFRRLAALTVIS